MELYWYRIWNTMFFMFHLLMAFSLLTVARQMKTINFQLSSQKCLEEGWTLRPPSPMLDDNGDGDVFEPEPHQPPFAGGHRVSVRILGLIWKMPIPGKCVCIYINVNIYTCLLQLHVYHIRLFTCTCPNSRASLFLNRMNALSTYMLFLHFMAC